MLKISLLTFKKGSICFCITLAHEDSDLFYIFWKIFQVYKHSILILYFPSATKTNIYLDFSLTLPPMRLLPMRLLPAKKSGDLFWDSYPCFITGIVDFLILKMQIVFRFDPPSHMY
jgi:hypothetical protein